MDNGKRFKNNINSAVAFDRIRGKIKKSIFVCRKSSNTYLRKWIANSEMVEVLELKPFEPYSFMQRIIKETPDPTAPEAICFGFKIKKLPKNSAFPEKVRIYPGSEPAQRTFELRKHAGSKTGIGSFSLCTGKLGCKKSRVSSINR